MSNEVKFKVGDVVVRTNLLERFPLVKSPLAVAKVYNGVVIYFDETGSLPWAADNFELYQPEQPQVQPMQPLVSIYDKALDLRFEHDVLGYISLREFFCNLLVKLWEEQDGFSGKRPYGNSDWDEPVYAALIKAGIISGEFYSEGYIKDCDYWAGSEFISKMIAHAFGCSFNKD